MDRFTWKAPDGTYQIDDHKAVRETLCCDENNKNWFSLYEGEAIDKLGRYEDLEEQGRLIILPCEVGDTVYVLDWYYDCDIDGYGVCDNYCSYGDVACDCCHRNVIKRFVSKREYINQNIDDFGKTIFLTREEAEEALKNM